MSGFDEVSLPLPFALGASGGPERRVDIVALASGREARNTPWAHGRRRYDIGGGIRSLDELHELIAFFEARRGRLRGFRFRDPFDWKSCAPSAAIGPLDQGIGEGDGEKAVFQLSKAYGDYQRTITKPIPGSVRVALDGEETAAFAVNTAEGLITFEDPPELGVLITAGFLFDTPVRFDMDRLDLSLDAFAAGRVLSAPLIEILT